MSDEEPVPPSLKDAARIALLVNWRTTAVGFIAALVLAASELPQLVAYKAALAQFSAAIAILGSAKARDAGVTQP